MPSGVLCTVYLSSVVPSVMCCVQFICRLSYRASCVVYSLSVVCCTEWCVVYSLSVVCRTERRVLCTFYLLSVVPSAVAYVLAFNLEILYFPIANKSKKLDYQLPHVCLGSTELYLAVVSHNTRGRRPNSECGTPMIDQGQARMCYVKVQPVLTTLPNHSTGSLPNI